MRSANGLRGSGTLRRRARDGDRPRGQRPVSFSNALGGEVFLGEVNGGRAVGDRGDDLPDGLGSDVAHGEDPGQRGSRRLVGDDVAASVQLQRAGEQLRLRRAPDADECAFTRSTEREFLRC